LQQATEAVAADTALRVIAIEDIAAGDNHAHSLVALVLAVEVKQFVMGQIGLVIDIEKSVLVLTDQFGHAARHHRAGGELIHQPGLKGQTAQIALQWHQILVQGVHIVVNRALVEFAGGFHFAGVERPQFIEPGGGVLTGFSGHIVASEGFHGALEITGAEHIDIDLELVGGGLEVRAEIAKPGDHHPAHGIEMNLIGITGQVVLILGVVVAHGDHRLAAAFEAFKGLAHFLKLAEAATIEIVELQQQGGDALVAAGRIDGVDQIPDGGFRIIGCALFHQLGEGVGVAALLDQYATGNQSQGRLFRQGFGIATKKEVDDDHQQNQHEYGVEQPAQGAEELANQREKAAYQSGFVLAHCSLPALCEVVSVEAMSLAGVAPLPVTSYCFQRLNIIAAQNSTLISVTDTQSSGVLLGDQRLSTMTIK